jgi:hypothetical protein
MKRAQSHKHSYNRNRHFTHSLGPHRLALKADTRQPGHPKYPGNDDCRMNQNMSVMTAPFPRIDLPSSGPMDGWDGAKVEKWRYGKTGEEGRMNAGR